MLRRKLFFTLMCALIGLCCAGIAHASVSDGRIVANFDKLETYGSTLHAVGWAYDAGNTGATVTIHIDYKAVRTASMAKTSENTTNCPVSGDHYFNFTYDWSTGQARLMIDALYTDDTGACNIYDNGATFNLLYTVNYNPNGGTGAPAADIKHHDISLRLSTTVPTRAGYTFKGWSTTSTGAVKYAAKGSYTANANATLYAVWEKNQYTLTYDANNGQNPPAAQTAYYGDSVTLSGGVPTREGCDFLGWSDTASGAAAYQPGGSLTLQANKTLYAVWQLKTYEVTYDANGGSGAPQAQVKTYGVDLSLSDDAPTRDEYVFLGWAASPSADSPTLLPGDTYADNAPLTLYAVWTLARIPGDVNGDTAVDQADAQLLLEYLADLPVEIVPANADVTGDDDVNGKDALRLMKYLNGSSVVLE